MWPFKRKSDQIQIRSFKLKRNKLPADGPALRQALDLLDGFRLGPNAAVIFSAAREMLPVFEGTHKIVPADAGERHEYGGEGISICIPTRDFLTEGTSRKGGRNNDRSQITERPAYPASVKPCVTVETVTPGDPRPPMSDFLTKPIRTVKITILPGEHYLWIDHEGRKHPTDKARLQSNKLIDRKRRRYDGPPPPPPEPPMRKGS